MSDNQESLAGNPENGSAETPPAFDVLRGILKNVSFSIPTFREVEDSSRIKVLQPAERRIEQSVTVNVKTARDKLTRSMEKQKYKKNITLESLYAFLQCIDTRFVQQKAGYGLSSNDFEDRYRDRIRTIEPNAERNVITSISVGGDPLPVQNREITIGVVNEDDIKAIMEEADGSSTDDGQNS